MQRRKAELVLGSGPPAFTAMAISFPIRVNCFAILSQRANMVAFLTSNMRPIIKLKIECFILQVLIGFPAPISYLLYFLRQKYGGGKCSLSVLKCKSRTCCGF